MYKTVLITGASRGIGRAIACAYARGGLPSGHQLFPLREGAAGAGRRIKGKPAMWTYSPASATYRTIPIWNSFFPQSEARFGGVDILVNNAGISHIGLLEDMTIDEWNRIIGVNLTSVFSASKLALPHMIHQKSGKILNISSIWGNVGASCEVAYSACKGGINSFTRALAKELAPSSIQVNAIACGVIDTEMNACFFRRRARPARRGDPPPGASARRRKWHRLPCRLPPETTT